MDIKNKKSRVFIVQNQLRKDPETGELVPRFDLSPAKIYGDFIFLLGSNAKPFRSDSVLKDLHLSLKDYSDNDYLLLIGSPVLIGFAVAIAADNNQGQIQLLQWNGDLNQYIVIKNNIFSIQMEK